MVGKTPLVRRETPRSVDDAVRLVVALDQRQRVLHLVSVGLHRLQRPADARQPEDHVRDLRRGVLHVLRGQLIERECAGGNDHRHVVFPGVQLAPETGGIRVHDIRPERLELRIQKRVHGERDADRLHGHLRDRDAFQPGDLLRRNSRHVGVAGKEFGTRLSDPVPEIRQAAGTPERIEPDGMTAPDQFGGDREHRIGVSECRDAEKRDAKGLPVHLRFNVGLCFHDIVSCFRGKPVRLLFRKLRFAA